MNAFDYWSWFMVAFVGLLVAFGVWETGAIVSGHREWTFTYKIRTWLGIEQKKPVIWAVVVFTLTLVGFVVWFVPHIVLGWWGGA